MARKIGDSGGRGFTLIEVMMVLVIVGIMAAITLPAYQSSVMKARRADGRAALTDLATRQEKFFAQNSSYTTAISAVGAGLGLGRTTSADGNYNLTSAACTGGAISRCYLLTATATGAQIDDTTCASFSLDNVGRKVAMTSASAVSPNCW
jgi:type IV pilus assembly protein PilE